MGNATSDAAEEAAGERVAALRDQLADMERAARNLSRRPQIDVLLPHQTRVHGHVVTCDASVRVLLGPVVGRVDATSARVLLEVDRTASLLCHVLIYDARTDAWVDVPQSCVHEQRATTHQPTVFRIPALLPWRQYRVVFSGVRKEDAMAKTASFRTPTLANGGALQCAVVSADDPYDLECGERSLWKELKRAVVDEQRVQLVIHLGGQVAMKRMFDKAWAMLVRYAECVEPPVAVTTLAGDSAESAFSSAWTRLERDAMEILRAAYRMQWTMSSDKAVVLAHASNLMLWSDWDVYPAFTTSPVFFVDHERPTVEMQVLRTVVRCARRLYQEYQRALWDDDVDHVFVREAEMCQIAEQALATTARIHHLGRQIPVAQADLDLQKKRREIEGARKAERHLRAVEAEKTKSEKALVSYSQLLAPQAGEEHFYSVGAVGFLFLDMRSARVEAGGSQQAENEVLSAVQWVMIERILEDESIQLLFVCSEAPVVDDLPHEVRLAAGSDVECDFRTWWGSNSNEQQRLLGLVFEWKLQREGRDAVFLCGSTNTRFAMKTVVRDARLRTEVEQWMAGPVTAQVSGHAIPSRSGTLFDRYTFEHSEVDALEKSLLYLDVNPRSASASATDAANMAPYSVTITRVDATKVQDLARVLLGPIIGHVDATSAVVLLEVDRPCDLVCVVTNLLTGERHRIFQHFEASKPNSFFINHLRSEHFYEVVFERIEDASQYRGSFTTLAKCPARFQLVAVGSADEFSTVQKSETLVEPLSNRTLWPWIHENLASGLPFRGVDKVIHFEQAELYAYRSISNRVDGDGGGSSKPTPRERDLLKARVRDVQRLQWGMPGVRRMLSRGSHLLLVELAGHADSEDTDELVLRACVDEVLLDYANLLLPPSKRVELPVQRLANPIQFEFGAFGMFVLPAILTKTTTAASDALWHRLENFLKTPLLSFIAVVAPRPIIEDSVEDAEEKARFDGAYRETLAFHSDKLRRMIELLARWQRGLQQEEMANTRMPDRHVVFLCGHQTRSFDSIIQEMVPLGSIPKPIVFRQFVVGPFKISATETKSGSLQSSLFPQGTLFGKYGYFHRFQRCVESAGVGGSELGTTTSTTTEEPSATGSVGSISRNQLFHLCIDLKPEIDDYSALHLTPSYVVSDKIAMVLPPSASIFDSPTRSVQGRVGIPTGDELRWTLEMRQPEWLQAVVSPPLNEQEEAMLAELLLALDLKAGDIETSFQRADPLATGLVAANDRALFVSHLCAAIEDFHRHVAGMAFRSKYPCSPSGYVINYTLEELTAVALDAPVITGAIDLEQYRRILVKCLQNAALFDARLNAFWS